MCDVSYDFNQLVCSQLILALLLCRTNANNFGKSLPDYLVLRNPDGSNFFDRHCLTNNSLYGNCLLCNAFACRHDMSSEE